MQAVAGTAPRRRSIPLIGHVDLPGLGVWLMAFLLVAYLALEGGGYDPLLRGEVGVAVWWIVLLGAAVGVLPAARLDRRGWTGLALAAALVAWTALSISWTESQERTVADLGKSAAYLGVFALTLCVVGRTPARHALNGLACAIGLVALLAVLSRLQPQLFPENELGRFFGETSQRRLAYPFNYWNGLAAFVAIGLPLVLRAATSARSRWAQSVAAAAVPVVALCVFYSISRGGAIVLLAAALAWILLTPDRLPKLLTATACAAGAAILVGAADQRDSLQTGISTTLARDQGDDLLTIMIVVCVGTALMQLAIGLLLRHSRRPSWTFVPRNRVPVVLVAVAAVAAAVAVSVGIPTTLADQWQEFKQPSPTAKIESSEDAFRRLESLSGNGRYQYWTKAADAAKTRPLAGIGAGSFEFWWARNATVDSFVRDAHSLYMETLAELGIVGLGLLVGFIAWALLTGLRRCSTTNPQTEPREAMAAATAGCLAFAVAAAGEWIWEFAAIATVLLVLVAVVLAGGDHPAGARRGRESSAGRTLLIGTAILGIVAVSIPLAGTATLRRSQELARSGDLRAALAEAQSAEAIQPYSTSAQVQKAIVLERDHDLRGAAAAIRAATEREPTNWRPWVIRSRIEATREKPRASLRAFQRARSLHPRSSLFQR